MTTDATYSPVFFIRKVPSLPAWLQFPAEHPDTPAAVNEIVTIPNSGHQSKGDLVNGIQPAYLSDPAGFASPYPIVQNTSGTYDSTVYQGDPAHPLIANRYGHLPVVEQYRNQDFFVAHQTYTGMALDTGVYSGRPANVLAPGVGDSHWRDNTLHRMVFGVDSPYYEVAILGTNYKNSKVGWGSGDVNSHCWTLPATGVAPHTGRSIDQWFMLYQIADHTLYQWTGTTPTNGAWQPVPAIRYGSAFPRVGPSGSHCRVIGTDYTQRYPFWALFVSNGTRWVDTTSGAWNTSEVDAIPAGDLTQDFRVYRHYDGSPRGGHSYTGYWCWEKDQLFIRVGNNTRFPVDAGAYDDMCAGNLVTRRWIGVADGDAPANPMWPHYYDVMPGLSSPDNALIRKSKNYLTEDIWVLAVDTMIVLRHATRKYEVWWQDPTRRAFSSGIHEVAWGVIGGVTDGLDFIMGHTGAIGLWWMYAQGTDKARKNITTITGYPELLSTLNPHYNGMLWNPDIQKFMYFDRLTSSTQFPLITIQLTNSATVDIQRYPLVGSATFSRYDAGEGVQTNWCFNRGYPRGVIYRTLDGKPYQFMRTAGDRDAHQGWIYGELQLPSGLR